MGGFSPNPDAGNSLDVDPPSSFTKYRHSGLLKSLNPASNLKAISSLKSISKPASRSNPIENYEIVISAPL